MDTKEFKKWMRYSWIAVPFVGFISGILLFVLRSYGFADILIATILAFLASDFLMWMFIRGGHGILQVRLFGTKTQPKGYGFIAFFLTIIGTAIFVNKMTEAIIQSFLAYGNELIADILVGLTLSVLVYLAVYVRFYAH
jgi:hypothetical protein